MLVLLARPCKACLAFLRARRDPDNVRIQHTRYQLFCFTSLCPGVNHLHMAARLLAPPKYGLQVSPVSQALLGSWPILWSAHLPPLICSITRRMSYAIIR